VLTGGTCLRCADVPKATASHSPNTTGSKLCDLLLREKHHHSAPNRQLRHIDLVWFSSGLIAASNVVILFVFVTLKPASGSSLGGTQGGRAEEMGSVIGLIPGGVPSLGTESGDGGVHGVSTRLLGKVAARKN
jgi:hypothetical protein